MPGSYSSRNVASLGKGAGGGAVCVRMAFHLILSLHAKTFTWQEVI